MKFQELDIAELRVEQLSRAGYMSACSDSLSRKMIRLGVDVIFGRPAWALSRLSFLMWQAFQGLEACVPGSSSQGASS